MADMTLDPQEIARTVARAMADDPEQVGDYVDAIAMDDNVTDFRFATNYCGYEGWQWSVTLYHDVEVDRWTVNESSLIPTDDALRPPAWVPWKDRLEPTDLSVTDAIGTEADDPRLEEGFRPVGVAQADTVDTDSADNSVDSNAGTDVSLTGTEDANKGIDSIDSDASQQSVVPAPSGVDADMPASTLDESNTQQQPEQNIDADLNEAVEQFDLTRRRVMSPLGRAQTAKRWYDGPRGPKSLSTKTASGNTCSTCGFFIPLKGELNLMFGVCANKWSPDDGRVVSLDHGCGEHSEIDPPEPSHLWVQSKPAFDDLHIDIIAQAPRDENAEVELIERMRDRDEDEATDEDIDANVTAEDDDPDETNEQDGPQVEETLNVSDTDDTNTDEPELAFEPVSESEPESEFGSESEPESESDNDEAVTDSEVAETPVETDDVNADDSPENEA